MEVSNYSGRYKRWVIGVTGASGMPYALRLIEISSAYLDHVDVVFSDAAIRVLKEEQGIKLSTRSPNSDAIFKGGRGNITFHSNKDIGSSIASGSHLTDGMVVVPCSMSSLGAIASGYCSTLIHRAADVVLKENRKLILVPRETPLSLIHLENLTKLARAGAIICPAMPGFYAEPRSISDLVDMMVMKILDLMGLNIDLVKRWGSEKSQQLLGIDTINEVPNFVNEKQYADLK